jgi:hypothetical protein
MTVNSLCDILVLVCLTVDESVRFIFVLITWHENHTYVAQYYFEVVIFLPSLALSYLL